MDALDDKVALVVGLFFLSCLAASLFYGWLPCVVGIVFAALLFWLLRGGK